MEARTGPNEESGNQLRMQEEAPAMVSTTQHHGVKPASIWRKFVRLITSILELMQHPALALLVGIALCCTAAGQTTTTSLAYRVARSQLGRARR